MIIDSIGIIWYGDFGKLIHDVVVKYYSEIQIKIFSRRQTPDQKLFFDLAEVCNADLLFPCVPISSFELQIENILDIIWDKTILVDVRTVKKYTSDILAKYDTKINYICTHPMFWPYSYDKIWQKLDWLRIVLTDYNISSDQYIFIKSMFVDLGLKVIEMTSDDHDQKLANTLFLTHLVGQAIHIWWFERTDIDTVSFGFLMNAVESVRNDTDLFVDVYKFNPYCKNVLDRFENTMEVVKNKIEI